MALDTVQDYVNETRFLLQDKIAPFRYDDPSCVNALNYAMMEARKVRPDLYLGTLATITFNFTTSDMASAVAFDPMYRMALVYHMAGYMQLQDDESENENRGQAFQQRALQMMGGSS